MPIGDSPVEWVGYLIGGAIAIFGMFLAVWAIVDLWKRVDISRWKKLGWWFLFFASAWFVAAGYGFVRISKK